MNEQTQEWQAVHVYASQWALWREQDEGKYTLLGISQKQAEYGATILNNGGIDTDPATNPDWIEELDEMVTVTVCDRCGDTPPVFRGELKDGLCTEHQP